jgi:nitrile hydratase
MDGIHDMGGLEGFGEVVRDEVVFHDEWERRAFGMQMTAQMDRTNTDEFRHSVERLDPRIYLTSSYYGRWLASLEVRLVERGLLTSDEVDARVGAAARPSATATIGLPHAPPDGGPVRTIEHSARFSPGEAVRVRVVHPAGHTRLPRYVRGRSGIVRFVHPAFVFPDTHAHGEGEQPHHVCSVSFAARELWGEGDHVVHVDIWESHLEPA